MLRQSDDMNILKSTEAPCLSAPTGMRWTVHSPLKLSPSPILSCDYEVLMASAGSLGMLHLVAVIHGSLLSAYVLSGCIFAFVPALGVGRLVMQPTSMDRISA